MNTRLSKEVELVLKRIGYLIGKFGSTDPDLDKELRRLYGQVKGLEVEADIAIEEITQMYLRNGAYPGDWVGWLDDDFTYDDPDDDEDRHKD